MWDIHLNGEHCKHLITHLGLHIVHLHILQIHILHLRVLHLTSAHLNTSSHLRSAHLHIVHLRLLHFRVLHLHILHLHIIYLHVLHIHILHLHILHLHIFPHAHLPSANHTSEHLASAPLTSANHTSEHLAVSLSSLSFNLSLSFYLSVFFIQFLSVSFSWFLSLSLASSKFYLYSWGQPVVSSDLNAGFIFGYMLRVHAHCVEACMCTCLYKCICPSNILTSWHFDVLHLSSFGDSFATSSIVLVIYSYIFVTYLFQ